MKKISPTVSLFILVMLLMVPMFGCEGEDGKSSRANRKIGPISGKTTTAQLPSRAISLRVLQEKLKACHGHNSCSLDILQLAGITTISGYVVDRATHDVILLGNVDHSSPPLYLEDFIVALRNAFMKYAELKGNIHYYSNPGCSIDPQAKVMQQLEKVGKELLESTSLTEINQATASWEHVCSAPQNVRVMGIPFSCHFSSTLVKADYALKRIADSSDLPGIDGLVGLSDMMFDKAKEELLDSGSDPITISSVNRFWFYPGENQYLEDEDVATIKECSVALLTEEEYLDRKGELTGSGRANELAQRFVENFTAKYTDLSKVRPIYKELESLFRFVALAKILKIKDLFYDAGLDVTYLLDGYVLPETSVERVLPGCFNVKKFDLEEDIPGGRRALYLRLPSCGGVSMEIDIAQNDFVREPGAKLPELRAAVLAARTSPQALTWDFSLVRQAAFDGGATSQSLLLGGGMRAPSGAAIPLTQLAVL